MSQLISLTTDSDGVFQNYFEDTIKIPANSEIAFIKAMGINMDYEEYNFLIVPGLFADKRDINILRVCVDGVNVSLTWKMLWQATQSLEQEAGLTPTDEELFFSGAYRWSLESKDPGNVITSICDALNQKFLFYKIAPNCSYNRDTFNGKAVPVQFGITSKYSVGKRLGEGMEDYIQNIGNHNVYTGSATTFAGQITTTSADTVVYSTTELAINGGFVTFSIGSDTEMKIGVSFTKNPNNNVTGTSSDINFDFGIHYKSNGTGTYTIIRNGDESEQTLGMNGTPTGNRPVDQFTIVFSRATAPESQSYTTYSCFLLQGYDPESGNGEYEDFIIARQDMFGGYSPTFMMEGNDDACIIKSIQCIPAEEQDRESRTFYDMVMEPVNNIVQAGGTIYRNSHFFFLKNSEDMDLAERIETRDFFNKLGFVNWNSAQPYEEEYFPMSTTFGNNNALNPLIISSRLEAKILGQKVVSNDVINQIQLFDEGTAPFPYLQLHIDDLNIISFEGNEPTGRQQNTATKVIANLAQQDDLSFEDKDEGDISVFKNYDYEAYNPIYITLHNTEELSINQIRARLVGPDNQQIRLANTGERSLIMLHVRKEQQS